MVFKKKEKYECIQFRLDQVAQSIFLKVQITGILSALSYFQLKVKQTTINCHQILNPSFHTGKKDILIKASFEFAKFLLLPQYELSLRYSK